MARLGDRLILDINIENVIAYKESLKAIMPKLDYIYLPFGAHLFHKVLCSWHRKFEEKFQNGVIVNVNGENHKLLCQVQLKGLVNECGKTTRDGLLYVTKIGKDEKVFWELQGEENYKMIRHANDHTCDSDCQNTTNFFARIHDMANNNKGDLTKFFKGYENRKNVELMWVFTAEAIRFPTLFCTSPDSYLNFCPSLWHKEYFSEWDNHARDAWLGSLSIDSLKPISNNLGGISQEILTLEKEILKAVIKPVRLHEFRKVFRNQVENFKNAEQEPQKRLSKQSGYGEEVLEQIIEDRGENKPKNIFELKKLLEEKIKDAQRNRNSELQEELSVLKRELATALDKLTKIFCLRDRKNAPSWIENNGIGKHIYTSRIADDKDKTSLAMKLYDKFISVWGFEL